jgi:hypothetical protein
MLNVAKVDRTRGSDWYTPAQLARIAAVRNEGYPPAGRSGVAAVVRKVRA